MSARTRMMLGFAVAALLVLAMSRPAAAQNGFSDFRQAADNQYGQPAPPPGGGQGQGPSGGGNNGNPNPGQGRPGREQGGRGRGRGDGRGAGRDEDAGTNALGDTTRGERGGSPPLSDAKGAELPFTGLDVTLLVLLGLLLVGAGLALRTAVRLRPR